MTQQQLTDIDNVNICYLSTLDRISRYAKDDATKEKYADAITQGGGSVGCHYGSRQTRQYAKYLKDKIEKADKANK